MIEGGRLLQDLDEALGPQLAASAAGGNELCQTNLAHALL
jgi:hypothetical protein